MDFRTRNLGFLFGLAPMGIGCGDRTIVGDHLDTGTDSSSDGTDSSSDGTDSSSDGGPSEDICLAYAENYSCHEPEDFDYVLEFCHQKQAFYSEYSTPECYASWMTSTVCFAEAECGEWFYECAWAIEAQIQACYYDDGVYNGCALYGMLVAECEGAAAGEAADQACEQTYEELYAAYYGGCGDAFWPMMVCISKLDCAALDNPELIEAGCGPEIAAKEAACS